MVEGGGGAVSSAPPSSARPSSVGNGTSSTQEEEDSGPVECISNIGSSVTRRGPGKRYSVRAAEVALHKALSVIRVEVILLDDSPHVFELQKRGKGQALLDLVFNHLELMEREYFGLMYRDSRLPAGADKRWLDPLKTVKKQLRIHSKTIDTCELPVLYFRVKFWVCEPSGLTDEYTRYHVVLQLRRLLCSGEMAAPATTAALLASYALQSDFGDYSPHDHGSHYLNDAVLLPCVPDNMLSSVIEMHKLHRGQSPADAEFQFLDHAKRLELYGVDLHDALDSSDRCIQVGVTADGLVVIHNGVKMNTFSWVKIIKIFFKRRQFMIQLRREMPENYESVLVFTLPAYKSCKNLWKSCVEHHTFFRLHSARPPPKRQMLSLGSKFWYSGRTQHQALREAKNNLSHSPSLRSFVRSPSKQASLATLGTNGASTNGAKRSFTTPAVTSGALLPRSRSDSSSGYRVNSLPATPKLAWSELEKSEDKSCRDLSFSNISSTKDEASSSSLAPLATQDVVNTSSSASSSLSSLSSPTTEGGKQPQEEEPSASSMSELMQNTTGEENEHGLITIRITPDVSGKFAGKFGFNVKGGCDQETPVLVSKVTAGSPADTCYPRLNEGDQVLLINGREVSSMTHEQVVNSIKASKECHSGELVLTVKQNVYEPDVSNEPAFRFVPDNDQQMSEGNVSSSAEAKTTSPPHQLKESMDLIETGLESGDMISRFEILYRRKPGLNMDIARLTKNKNRNRYGDISPYDTTRVILKNASSPTTDISANDYINASHVIMDVAGSGIRNAYIASQGPLSSTSPHFWQMIWEQKTNLVVMLTTCVEQGRSKCHQYWPEVDGTADYGNFSVDCKSKETPSGFAVRSFTLTNKMTKESRAVTHMQYLAWPDHGVPQHSTDFLTFIQRVRAVRAESESTVPTVVHCSAGIGRTGVLILMETAQCLIEANQPVYPLDLVKTMRDQRAMMIQTSGQFRFVCEAICRVYSEKLIKPLEKYITAR